MQCRCPACGAFTEVRTEPGEFFPRCEHCARVLFSSKAAKATQSMLPARLRLKMMRRVGVAEAVEEETPTTTMEEAPPQWDQPAALQAEVAQAVTEEAPPDPLTQLATAAPRRRYFRRLRRRGGHDLLLGFTVFGAAMLLVLLTVVGTVLIMHGLSRANGREPEKKRPRVTYTPPAPVTPAPSAETEN